MEGNIIRERTGAPGRPSFLSSFGQYCSHSDPLLSLSAKVEAGKTTTGDMFRGRHVFRRKAYGISVEQYAAYLLENPFPSSGRKRRDRPDSSVLTPAMSSASRKCLKARARDSSPSFGLLREPPHSLFPSKDELLKLVAVIAIAAFVAAACNYNPRPPPSLPLSQSLDLSNPSPETLDPTIPFRLSLPPKMLHPDPHNRVQHEKTYVSDEPKRTRTRYRIIFIFYGPTEVSLFQNLSSPRFSADRGFSAA